MSNLSSHIHNPLPWHMMSFYNLHERIFSFKKYYTIASTIIVAYSEKILNLNSLLGGTTWVLVSIRAITPSARSNYKKLNLPIINQPHILQLYWSEASSLRIF